MSTDTMNFNPPRAATVPQVPLPQTCFGVLEHTGIPYADQANVTDIPPDFSWMTEMHTFVKSFEYKQGDDIGKTLIQFAVHSQTAEFNKNALPWDDKYPRIWQEIPFFCSKWWTGTPSFKFLAIKPPRVTGKLIVRYTFKNTMENNPSYDPMGTDTYYRGIAKEWDLGASNEFEFDVPALNSIEARPTWLPSIAGPIAKGGDPAIKYLGRFADLQSSPSTYMMGRIYIESAQKLQPGSIFPPSIRILVFRCFKNSQFYIPQDPRSECQHILYSPVAGFAEYVDPNGFR